MPFSEMETLEKDQFGMEYCKVLFGHAEFEMTLRHPRNDVE